MHGCLQIGGRPGCYEYAVRCGMAVITSEMPHGFLECCAAKMNLRFCSSLLQEPMGNRKTQEQSNLGAVLNE